MTVEPCGHNHEPNPYTDPERADMYRRVVHDLFNLASMSSIVDVKLTVAYGACIAIVTGDRGDHMPTIRALTWELGRLVNMVVEGEPTFQIQYDDDDDPDDPAAKFGVQAMTAFLAAAGPGDLQSAVNVLDAVAADAVANQVDPDLASAHMFGNLLASMAYTVRVRHLAEHALGLASSPDDDEH
jgi:hypothetical protein